jgi:hypothetical protein
VNCVDYGFDSVKSEWYAKLVYQNSPSNVDTSTFVLIDMSDRKGRPLDGAISPASTNPRASLHPFFFFFGKAWVSIRRLDATFAEVMALGLELIELPE